MIMHYKDLYLWHNDLRDKWIVQAGYSILAEYDSLKGAKIAISRKWSKEYFDGYD